MSGGSEESSIEGQEEATPVSAAGSKQVSCVHRIPYIKLAHFCLRLLFLFFLPSEKQQAIFKALSSLSLHGQVTPNSVFLHYTRTYLSIQNGYGASIGSRNVHFSLTSFQVPVAAAVAPTVSALIFGINTVVVVLWIADMDARWLPCGKMHLRMLEKALLMHP